MPSVKINKITSAVILSSLETNQRLKMSDLIEGPSVCPRHEQQTSPGAGERTLGTTVDRLNEMNAKCFLFRQTFRSFLCVVNLLARFYYQILFKLCAPSHHISRSSFGKRMEVLKNHKFLPRPKIKVIK